MFQWRQFVLLAVGGMSAMSAWADPANHVVANFGDINLPFTRSIGNTFSATGAGAYVSQDGSPALIADAAGGLSDPPRLSGLC